MTWLGGYLTSFIIAFISTGLIRRYALASHMLDIPNHRSSHTVPTPRGGGLAFVIAFLLLIQLFLILAVISTPTYFAFMGCGGSIAILGFVDDRYDISAKWRLLVHFFSCALALYLLHGMSSITFFGLHLPTGIVINSLGVIYLVWLLNLYNFMDGIDGIAALEAIFVCLAAAIIYYLHNYYANLYLPLGLAISVSGFLIWNFPPARIFMGDAGSGFLGLILGLFSIQALQINAIFFWCWIILLGVFIVDATVTLIQRGINKEKLQQAHCSHAYQHASNYFNSHKTVSLWVLAINLLWLFPLSIGVSYGWIEGFSGVIIAYTPLIFLALKFKAGIKFT